MNSKLFRVRLNCIDHYQAPPTRYDPQLRNDVKSSHQASRGPRVPVIRIFGSTEAGQKVCAHVHGAFPYLFIPYDGSLVPDEVGAYIYRLHLSIDHALAVSYRRPESDKAKFVARITLIKGIPFYGFHVGYQYFLKIYVFNPVVMTRLADLLQQGIILKHKFQPYEAHIPYLLQFMVDYNLYGCSFLDATRARFRAPLPCHDEDSTPGTHLWTNRTVPGSHVTDDIELLPRLSHCALEVDICVQDIQNRKFVKERRLHHDFIERSSPMPADARLVPSMAGLWEGEERRRASKTSRGKPNQSPFPPDALVSMSAGPRESQPNEWVHEEEHRQLIADLISNESIQYNDDELSFDSFVIREPLESTVRTALQSVEDLYPSVLRPALGLVDDIVDANPSSSIDVDEENLLPAQPNEDDYFPWDSDEDDLLQLGQEVASLRPKRTGETDNSDSRTPTTSPNVSSPSQVNSIHIRGLEIFGVCLSGAAVGSLPSIPIFEEFLSVAEQDLFTSRALAPDSAIKKDRKRRWSFISAGSAVTTVKRLKQNNHRLIGQSLPSLSSQSGRPKKTVSSRSRAKDGAQTHNQTLNFPTVKRSSQSQKREREQNSQTSLPLSTQRSTTSEIAFDTTDKVSSLTPSSEPKRGIAFDLPDLTQGSSNSIDALFLTIPDPFTTMPASSQAPQSPILSHEWHTPSSSLENPHKRHHAIGSSSRTKSYVYSLPPPSVSDVLSTMAAYQLPDVIYQDAYYSNENDVPPRPREYAGRQFRLQGNTLPFLPAFEPYKDADSPCEPDFATAENNSYESRRSTCNIRSWEFGLPPPSYTEVEEWWEEKTRKSKAVRSGEDMPHSQTPNHNRFISQITGPTPKGKYVFKYSQQMKSASVKHEAQYMSIMSLEIHVNTRGKLVPNPEEDRVECIFWCLEADGSASESSSNRVSDKFRSGVIVLSDDESFTTNVKRQATSSEINFEDTELDLLLRTVEIVRNCDPDILTGYEVHSSSWGYIIERARLKYDFDLCDEFSRMKSLSNGRFGKDKDRWGFNTTSSIRITGRHMINIWRAMSEEVNLLQYTLENVTWNLLHRRVPHYSHKTLTAWYKSGRAGDLYKVLRHYQIRTRLDLEIIEGNELVPRTSEQARLLGVDFFSVFSRGSQFKVESIMSRIAKPENYLLVSPSRKQVGSQNALECLPLVMEPQSAFYTSPVVVLDFQSLYPSVMIAYNYCYSTFLGRIVNWRGKNKMGFTDYERQRGLLALLKDYINIAPNGMMYVRSEIRKSLLAKMLIEILETRFMVKNGMKEDKDDAALQRLLNNRQLALKLLANVTYGYTSASFSGRMPCAEIADSIVQTGRETLERSIAYIHSVPRWGAEVVYGDTDSLFIHLKGRTKDQAFDIGNEIAEAVTAMNPRPIKLKFEKVYLPCVLLAKKRYVGYKYETRDQKVPEFDAKGIETVRRDGTPAEQKIEEKALRLLFETADLSRVKSYFQEQCDKIMRGTVSIQDFCFAKEVRLGTYSDKGPPPPGALISARRMLEDSRAEPQYRERVPYVVVSGAPGARLSDRCVDPEDLLANPDGLHLDAEYYIGKNLIPPLERIFNLVGANVRQWYDTMPRIKRANRISHQPHQSRNTVRAKRTLESYMAPTSCTICAAKSPSQTTTVFSAAQRDPPPHPLCQSCRTNIPQTLQTIHARLAHERTRHQMAINTCQSCAGLSPGEEIRCESKDCPVYYSRVKQEGRLGREVRVGDGLVAWLEREDYRRSLEW